MTMRIAEKGRMREFLFDDLPETIYAKLHRKSVPARMLVSLPRNYNRTATFPLLVYLGGGDGGPVKRADLAWLQKLTGDEDYISVVLPLFKRAIDPQEYYGGAIVGAYDDYPLMSRCYKTMLSALLAVIPNIDPKRSVFGGYSNGAHATALLISAVDPFLLKHFQNFYFLEGGLFLTSHHKSIVRSKNFVYFVGGSRRSKSRRALLQFMDAVYVPRNLPNVTVVKIPGAEHTFPPEYMPQLLKWFQSMNSAEPGKSSVRGKPHR